tara:strand:- start:487 stop:777 length:291 start_codon:yes stop_codon:yes gene_type:complete
VNPYELGLTFGQLVDAADAVRTERWDHTAQLLCLIHNANRGPGTSPSRIEDWHPLRKRKRRRSQYTSDVVTKIHNELASERPVQRLIVSPSQVVED